MPVQNFDRAVALEQFGLVLDAMREESRACVAAWLASACQSLGGVLVLQAPSSSAKRDLPEAAIASERFTQLLGV